MSCVKQDKPYCGYKVTYKVPVVENKKSEKQQSNTKLKDELENLRNQNANFLRAIRKMKQHKIDAERNLNKLDAKLEKINTQTITKIVKPKKSKKIKQPAMTLKELNAQIAKHNARVQAEKDAFFSKWEKFDEKELDNIEKTYNRKVMAEKKKEIKDLKKGRKNISSFRKSSPIRHKKSRRLSRKRKISHGSFKQKRPSFVRSLAEFRKDIGNPYTKGTSKSKRRKSPKKKSIRKKSPKKKSSVKKVIIHVPLVRRKPKK